MATVAGFSITTQAVSVRHVIGYVPQAISVDGTLTGYENLLIFAKLYDLPRRERRARILEALAFMGLSGVADRLVREYSGGMIRRLEIAQSTLHRPPLVFLDEPTTGLDPIARKAVWEHLAQLREDCKTTIFFTTHYMEEAESHCDRVAIMHLGKLVALGICAKLKAAIGGTDTTLDDVFAYYAGTKLEDGGNYHEHIHAKTLVDVTNPITSDHRDLTIGHGDSGAEAIARHFPMTNVVKAFNAVFAEVYASQISQI